MNVSASIVTHNNEKEIVKTLKCLLNVSAADIKLIVLDNASTDKTAELIESRFPSITLIRSNKNVGFGAGHNIALQKIDSDVHIIVNPDIIVENDEIKKMLEYMAQHPDIAILTPKVLNMDGTEQFLPKREPNLKYLIGGRLERFGEPFYRMRSEYTLRGEGVSAPVSIDFCTGCFMVCRTDMLKKCGGFDERFFLYFEDVDLTRRMKQYGKTLYNPAFSVYHAWNREDGKSGRIMALHMKSMIQYFWKWRCG